ncbi:MAG: DUF3662 domain-containing protein [Propionibacteriaceae bacterium]|nr:DUF3662 domain-containing protein [Propionibacteriaceae bacterium]
MGLFDKMERGIESAVHGAFASVFKGDVEPVEIATALQKELDAAAKVLSQGRMLVPNNFRVSLARADYDRLAPYSRTLNAEIIPGLRDHAASRRYVFNGPITIAYLLDDKLTSGRFAIVSSTRAGVSDAAEPRAEAYHRQLVLEVNGVRHPLTPPGFTIGRGTEADLRINDPGVSRLHAQISVEDGGDDNVHVTITDLGSTNGLIVNGQKVRSVPLVEGSRIEIGTTRMLVHSPVGE